MGSSLGLMAVLLCMNAACEVPEHRICTATTAPSTGGCMYVGVPTCMSVETADTCTFLDTYASVVLQCPGEPDQQITNVFYNCVS
jgi:hypothetical protein